MERPAILDYFGLRKEIYVTVSGDFRNIPREIRYRLYPRLPDVMPPYEQYPTKESFAVRDITFYFEGEMKRTQGDGHGTPIYRAKEF